MVVGELQSKVTFPRIRTHTVHPYEFVQKRTNPSLLLRGRLIFTPIFFHYFSTLPRREAEENCEKHTLITVLVPLFSVFTVSL